MVLDEFGNGFEAGERLEATLGLPGLARLVAEALHEGLHMGALLVLLLLEFGGQRLALAALALEIVVVAAEVGELAAVEMKNAVDRVVEEVAVVADDQHRVRIVVEEALEPQGALEVEIVGGLVEKQDVGFVEERRRQRHPHPPAARKAGAGRLLALFGKSEAGQNARRPRRRGMGILVGKPDLDLGDPVGIARRLGLGEKRSPLGIARQHGIEQAFGPARRLLGDGTDPRPP